MTKIIKNHDEVRRTRVIASPRARREMTRLRIDARQIQGSGPEGRIVLADVRQAAGRPCAGSSTMRKTIATRTAESFATVPHYYLRTEFDATALVELRTLLVPETEQKTGVRLTLTDFFLRALALALRDCPEANSVWRDDGSLKLPSVDVGLVIAVEGGLFVPLIRQADACGLAGLARERAALIAAARAGLLQAGQMQGGASSLSNLGASRVDEFSGIISPSHSTLLAVGRLAPRPFVVNGSLAVRPTVKLCLSVDHRVLDGAPAAVFLGTITELLENPRRLLD